MEAVAGCSRDDEPSARRSGASEKQDLLVQVAGLACRVVGVEEAVVLVREHAGSAALREVARAGRARSRRGAAARCPIVVEGEERGLLAVTGRGSLSAQQLELLGDLAELAAGSLEERDLRLRAEAVGAAAVDVLARAVDMRDAYTGRHSAQVGELARRVGERLGMGGTEITLLECAARLHDVGKLGVPDTILRKPGPLDQAEWQVMRRHPEWGAEMVSKLPGLERVGAFVGAHHERWDGLGYPDGLAGESIPLASRVISVCDAYEAMVSQRPYRARLSARRARAELASGAGSQFDPAVVAAVEAELGG
jgi:HD-GYP domain-containing protein (c-di-GMP phosphodiesterase class II)